MCIGIEHIIRHRNRKSNRQTSLVSDVALTTSLDLSFVVR
jgi:hypothetical protein